MSFNKKNSAHSNSPVYFFSTVKWLLCYSFDHVFVADTPVSLVSPCLDVLWTGWWISVYSHSACFASWHVSLLEWDLGRENGESLDHMSFEMLVGICGIASLKYVIFILISRFEIINFVVNDHMLNSTFRSLYIKVILEVKKRRSEEWKFAEDTEY